MEDEYKNFLAVIFIGGLILFGCIAYARAIKPRIEQRELLDSLKMESLRLEIELKNRQLNGKQE